MRRNGLATCLLALALPVSAAAADASASASRRDRQAEEELGEVFVEGQRIRQRTPQQSFDWLARLVGEFTVDGQVAARADGVAGEPRRAQGQVTCVGFGIAPGVQCELRVRWADATGPDGAAIPGGVSTLDPAVLLFGFNLGDHADAMYGAASLSRSRPADDGETYTIAHIMVDNTGVAEGGAGYRAGTDTMTSRAPCVAIPVDCERVVRMIAPADLQTVEMRIDLEIRHALAIRYDLVWHRVPDSKSVVYGRKPAKEPAAKKGRK